MNEVCEELTFEIVPEEVAIATAVVRIDYYTITATQEACIQFQQDNSFV